MSKTFLQIAVFLTAASSLSRPQLPKHQVLVGFLDDTREEMVDWKPGVPQHRLIRPAFEKTASGWRAVPIASVPLHAKWTIAFDGRRLGTVEGETPTATEAPGSDVDYFTPVQHIVKGAIPEVGEASQKFAGIMAIGPTRVLRPVVVISEPFFADPDGWKRVHELPDTVKHSVRDAFRRDFPHVDRCGTDENVLEHNWKFPDSALEFSSMYASNKRSFLVETDLHAGVCGYVDDPNDPLAKPWFFVTADGSERGIGGFMTLIDAGDYDNDSRSELVFFLSQPEDTDGFILFNAELREQAKLIWHYH